MENLNRPAHAYVNGHVTDSEDHDHHYGLSKLEYAAIHIAANLEGSAHLGAQQIADTAVVIARAVLDRCEQE